MADSAFLKIDRAVTHVRELNDLLVKKRPFALVVRTNTDTSERFLLTRKNQGVIDEAALICGDAIHNTRAALDHAYWEIVSPYCRSDQERRRVQFPFTREASGYKKTLENRRAFTVGTGFFHVMLGLRAYGEKGGNALLYLAEELDVLDKHKLLIPATDYSNLSREKFMKLLPDWPQTVAFKSITFEGFMGKIKWYSQPPRDQLGVAVHPSMYCFERELDVPCEVVLKLGSPGARLPLISTLNEMIDTVRKAIGAMREGAATY